PSPPNCPDISETTVRELAEPLSGFCEMRIRGIARLESAVVSSLLFLSPVTAVLLGWVFLDQTLTLPQIAGVVFVIGSIWLAQRPNRNES
ncbi:DMT family transporter, partial [Mesorhizobium sp. M1300]|uniref:DMT family transporter n=1 Tax=Mesorhizobium sp. M1300 TaxID=2957077 RepID=UPI00333838B7